MKPWNMSVRITPCLTLPNKNFLLISLSIINKSFFTVDYRGLNKLDRNIKVHKDQTEHQHKNNVIYKIYCKDCNASYVGQTKRQLKTRIREHYNNIKLDDSRHSVVTQHMIKHDHAFDWKNVRILDSESNYNKRLISEMLHIKEQSNGINLMKEFLDDSYYCLLDILSKNNL